LLWYSCRLKFLSGWGAEISDCWGGDARGARRSREGQIGVGVLGRKTQQRKRQKRRQREGRHEDRAEEGEGLTRSAGILPIIWILPRRFEAIVVVWGGVRRAEGKKKKENQENT